MSLKKIYEVKKFEIEENITFSKDRITQELLDKINLKGKISLIALRILIKEIEKKKNKLEESYYQIYWQDFFKRLGEKNTTENKKNYIKILEFISNLKLPFSRELEDWKIIEVYEPILKTEFNLNFKGGKWVKDFFILYTLSNWDFIFSHNSKFTFINPEILKLKTSSECFKNFVIDVDWILKNLTSKIYKITFENIFKKLNLNQSSSYENLRKVENHLKKAKIQNAFKEYKIDKNQQFIEIIWFSKEDKIENEIKYNKEIHLFKNKIEFECLEEIDSEKKLNDFLFKKLKEKFWSKYKIEKEYEFKVNWRRCKVDTALFNKNDSKDIIFIEYKKTKNKRAPAQVLWYSGSYEQLNWLNSWTIKSLVIQNEFTWYDVWFANSIPHLFFYKYNLFNNNLSLSSILFD